MSRILEILKQKYLVTSGDLYFDLSENFVKRTSFVMIFDELSNAFFLFLLRASGAELDGGGVFKHPRPGAD